MNLSPFWQQLIQKHVPLMPKRMIFYKLMAGKGSENMQRGTNLNQSCHGVQDQASRRLKLIHVWLPHPQLIQGSLGI